MRRIFAFLAALTSIAACASTTAPPRVTYACSDGSTLSVQFVDGAALVKLPEGNEVRLAQQPVGSGLWYATPKYELRGKGDEATWSVARRAPVNCRARR